MLCVRIQDYDNMIIKDGKNKSYCMNFKHQNTSCMPLKQIKNFKVHVVWLAFFYKFGLLDMRNFSRSFQYPK